MDDPRRIPTRAECVVGDLLQRWARERPAHPFLEFEDGTVWSFVETLDRVQRAAGALRGLGVRQGSHVLGWMPNRREAVLGWLAANYLGAVHVPLNTGYRGRLLQHAIDVSGATVLLADASLLPRLADIAPARLRDVIVIGGSPPDATPLRCHAASILEGETRAEPERPIEP
jgi:crotonobetaine/carnitine-CoA ligase